MSDMSFKQAKELVERLEFAELTLKKTLDKLDNSPYILDIISLNYKKLNNMKIIVALNIGVIIGLLIGKYLM